MQVVRQAPGASALHERVTQTPNSATEQRAKFLQCRLIFLIAPRPVAMQVDVVVSEALLGGQPRAQAPVSGFGDARLFEPERREQHPQSLNLVFVGLRDVFQASAGARRQIASLETGAHRCRFRREVLGKQIQASAPFRQCLARLRKQPGNFADDRKAAAAAAAHPAGALQRDRATPATRTGQDTRQ